MTGCYPNNNQGYRKDNTVHWLKVRIGNHKPNTFCMNVRRHCTNGTFCDVNDLLTIK